MKIQCAACLEFKNIECGQVVFCSSCGHAFNLIEVAELWDTLVASNRIYRRRLNVSLVIFIVLLFALLAIVVRINRIMFFPAGVIAAFVMLAVYNSASSWRISKMHPSVYKNSRVKL